MTYSLVNYNMKNISKNDIINKFVLYNTHELPHVKKVSLSITMPSPSFHNILSFMAALKLMAAKQPYVITNKRMYFRLKIQKGTPVGCKLNFKGHEVCRFLDNLINNIIPNCKNLPYFLGEETLFYRVENMYLYKEIEQQYEHFSDLPAVTISVTIKGKTQKIIKYFLRVNNFYKKYD